MNYILQTNSLTKKYKNFQAIEWSYYECSQRFHLWLCGKERRW